MAMFPVGSHTSLQSLTLNLVTHSNMIVVNVHVNLLIKLINVICKSINMAVLSHSNNFNWPLQPHFFQLISAALTAAYVHYLHQILKHTKTLPRILCLFLCDPAWRSDIQTLWNSNYPIQNWYSYSCCMHNTSIPHTPTSYLVCTTPPAISIATPPPSPQLHDEPRRWADSTLCPLSSALKELCETHSHKLTLLCNCEGHSQVCSPSTRAQAAF